MTKPRSQYILVIGCGRLGACLATRLSAEGHSVVVIDVDDRSFSALGVEFGGFRMEGDAAELAVLRQAKADKADCLLAVTGSDNINLAASQVGKRLFHIPNVVARVSNHDRENVFRDLGVRTVSPMTLALESLLSQVRAGEAEEQSG
jgi:trk system potassium uptake protein TrkA